MTTEPRPDIHPRDRWQHIAGSLLDPSIPDEPEPVTTYEAVQVTLAIFIAALAIVDAVLAILLFAAIR